MADTEPQPDDFDIHLPVTIRQAVKDDLPKLEHEGQFARFRNLFRRAYREQQSGRRLMLVADSNNYPIGRLFILFNSSDRRIADGKHRAYLYSFYVMPPFRGMGVGTRMVRYAESILQMRGFYFATIAVAKDNPGALRLYERLDYITIRDDPGKWNYTDHMGRTHRIVEPCWILEKRFDVR